MSVKSVPIKLVPMADVFEDRLSNSYNALKRSHVGSSVEVPDDRKFIGFDAYKHAIDSLKKGDVAIFTTPLAFRWVHFTYAIEKGVNVFMEKPLTADGPSSRKMLKLAEQATAKNMKVGVGLMSRHHRPFEQLHQKIQDGQIGDLILMRGYRMHGPVGSAFSTKWPGDPSELLWQIRRFHSFIWASGGCFNDFYIHHIDHLCWMKNAWPVKAQALGGRHYKLAPDGSPYVDQNFDTYSVEYTFEDGAKMIMDGRCMNGALSIYKSFAQGSKGMAIVSPANDFDSHRPCQTFSTQNPDRAHQTWASTVKPEEQDPYLNEWVDLVEAIRSDKPYNEVPRSVMATNTCNMGRMAAHTGQEVAFDEALNHEEVYAPGIENWTMDSAAPLQHDADGRYPIPMPGLLKNREYGPLAG
jgi:predicted dehydrogenase